MRILFINSEFPPVGAGAGNASANLARLLVQSGYQVVVVTTQYNRLADDEVIDGVRVVRGPAHRKRVDRSTVLEQIFFVAGAAYRCIILLHQFRPDVVLAFFGLPSGAVAWMLKALYRIPYVVSLRGGDVPGFRKYDFWLYHRVANPVLRIIWHEAATVVANSAGLKALAMAFNSSIPILIIPNGVDTQRYTESNREWTIPHILSVGRVVHQKGFDLALSALADLHDLEWEWRIAGDGPELPTLKHAVLDHNLSQRVHFLGWQTSDQLKEEYAKADLFLFPSRDEGMPNAILEAMASGLPVVASRIAGNEELVIDGETGALVPTENVEALRDTLQNLLNNRQKLRSMGHAGRERVERTYGWQTTAAQYQNILEQAAK